MYVCMYQNVFLFNYIYIYIYIYVCICVCVLNHYDTHTHTHTHNYMCMFLYRCLCMCRICKCTSKKNLGKKLEYCEMGQHFLSFIAESETHVLYRCITHRVKYFKPLFLDILMIMAYR